MNSLYEIIFRGELVRQKKIASYKKFIISSSYFFFSENVFRWWHSIVVDILDTIDNIKKKIKFNFMLYLSDEKILIYAKFLSIILQNLWRKLLLFLICNVFISTSLVLLFFFEMCNKKIPLKKFIKIGAWIFLFK